MVQAEVMACGVPVICSDSTGGEEISRHGVDGFVVPTRDVHSLMERILYLYEHEEMRKRMGRQARARVKTFTWDQYGRRVAAAYRTLLQRGKA